MFGRGARWEHADPFVFPTAPRCECLAGNGPEGVSPAGIPAGSFRLRSFRSYVRRQPILAFRRVSWPPVNTGSAVNCRETGKPFPGSGGAWPVIPPVALALSCIPLILTNPICRTTMPVASVWPGKCACRFHLPAKRPMRSTNLSQGRFRAQGCLPEVRRHRTQEKKQTVDIA